MALMLKMNRIDGLRFFQSISSRHSFGVPETLQTWMWMASYPTIFDSRSYELLRVSTAANKPDSFSEAADFSDNSDVIDRLRQHLFSSLIKDPKLGPQTSKIIQQVNFNIGTNPVTFQTLLADQIRFQDDQGGRKELIEETRAMLFDKNGTQEICIVSAGLMKSLLEESLKTSLLTDFFHTAFRLQVLTCKTPMETGIIEYLKCVGYPRLKYYINQSLLTDTPASTIVKTLTCALKIITDPYSTLSSDQLDYLLEKLMGLVTSRLGSSETGQNYKIEELKRLVEGQQKGLHNNHKFLNLKSKIMKMF